MPKLRKLTKTFASVVSIPNMDAISRIDIVINDDALFTMPRITPAGGLAYPFGESEYLLDFEEPADFKAWMESTESESDTKKEALPFDVDKEITDAELEKIVDTFRIGLRLTEGDDVQLLIFSGSSAICPATMFLYTVGTDGQFHCFWDHLSHYIPNVKSTLTTYKLDIEEKDVATFGKVMIDNEDYFPVEGFELPSYGGTCLIIPLEDLEDAKELEIVRNDSSTIYKIHENFELEEVKDPVVTE